MTSMPDDVGAETIIALTTERGAEKSICPSEAARALSVEQWRPLLPSVRRIAVALALAGRIEILRKGKPVDPTAFRGVYRLRIKPKRDDDACAP